MIAVLLAIVAVPVAVSLYDLIRRPDIRRHGVRNIVRHRGEAVLIVVGTLLGTAIITASFVVGDSLEGSIRDLARTELGEIDETIVADDAPRQLVLDALTTTPIPGVDGVLVVDAAPATVVSDSAEPLGEPRATVFALDVEAAARFGSDPATTGFDGVTPPALGEAIVNTDVAREIEVGPGDTIVAHLYGTSVQLEVIEVIDAIGLAGRGNPVFVAPAQLDALASDNGETPRTEIHISNDGDTFSGADSTPQVVAELERRLTGLDIDIRERKASLLAEADVEGNELTTLFAGIGSFAVIAGILLLVNLFTMLAEERRTDLGIMRALGTRRNVVVRQMALEGSLYAAVAAIAGAAAGAGVGWVIMQFASSLLENDGLTMAFSATTESLMAGALIGAAISLATVWATSVRIARLNIIRAIRQLPEPPTDRSRRRRVTLGVLGVGAGVGLTTLGVGGGVDLAAVAGPAVAGFSAVALTSKGRARTGALTVASLFAIGWGASVFTILDDTTAGSGISAFVVQGLVMVAGAVMLVTTHDRIWARILPDSVAVRLGLANPLAKRGRTGLVVSMYALVIFMITFMAVFAAVFTRQADDLAGGVAAGHDLFVDSSIANPVTAAELEAVDGVVDVSVLERAGADFGGSWSDARWGSWVAGLPVDFFDNGDVRVVDRGSRFATDAEALQAVFTDPSAIIVSEEFLIDGNGPGGTRPRAGDTVTADHPDTGRIRTYTVVAVTTADWVFTGPMMSANALRDLAGANMWPIRAYVRLADDITSSAAADDVAAMIDARFIANGTVSSSFVAEVEAELAETDGFIRILSGYLGLGLAIGIAGLGVVMVRAVRERRREIGMLRAIGISGSTVRRAFLLEAGFIGFLGATIGTGLGLLTGYQVVTNSTLFGDVDVSYVTPWTMVAIVSIGPWVASLLATAVPAARASSIRPAAALRITT